MKKLLFAIVAVISIFATACTDENVIPDQETLNTTEKSLAGGSASEGPDIATD